MEASEPPIKAEWPCYSSRALPTYRFLPGLTPHPHRDPLGHSFAEPEPRPRPFEHHQWSNSEDYLYAIDLYNFFYWWEAHEVFEGLWHACGRKTTAGNFFQALIQFAAAHLKRALGNEIAAHNLARSGLLRLQNSPTPYMGLDTVTFADDVTLWMGDNSRPGVRIRLRHYGNGPSVSKAP
mgnify:FL=1